MAQQKVVLEVVVSDNGTTKIVTKGIDNLGQSADRTGKKIKGAADAQNELNYKLNQGTTGVSSAARSFSKLNQAIGAGPNGLVGAYATLAANAFAVSAAFNALREAAQVEQMMKGLEIQGGRTGIALKTVSQNLQELTGYSISAADAMKTVSLMSSAGFAPTAMESLTKVATNAAYALGRNVPDALDRISKGVTKLEPELLDELGIMTKLSEAQSRYALENNKSVSSLTSFEKRQAMLNAVISEGELKFGGLSEQVSANPFDKLGASFDNLIKNVLSVINTIAGPLASIFSNKGMLLGSVILFGATIRRQLLPALYLMGKVSREMRDQHLEEAKAIRDKTKATLDSAKADKIAAVEASKQRLLSARSKALPKGFDLDTASQGLLDQKALDKETKRLQSSIDTREKNLVKNATTWNQEKRDQKQEEIKQIKEAKSALESYYDTQKSNEVEIAGMQASLRKSNLDFYAKKKLASAADIKSQAVESAYAGNLKEAWKQAAKSVKEYQLAVEAEGRSNRVGSDGKLAKQSIMGRAIDATRVLGARAATFASVGAAAFMRFIPYVGVASTALSGAWSIYEKFIKSDAAKAHDEALRKLKETLDQTAESVKQFNRISMSSASIGTRTAEALTLQSNTATTMVQAFKEVEESQKAMSRDSGKVDSFFSAMIGGQDAMISYQTGISQSDDMFAAAEAAYGGDKAAGIGMAIGAAIGAGLGAWVGGPVGGAIGFDLGLAIGGGLATWVQGVLPEELNGIDEAALESARAVSQLRKIIGSDLADSMVAAAGGSEALANSPALRAEFIKQIGEAYIGVADAVKSLQEAFTQTGAAITQFFTDAIPKTPFDGMVKGYESVNKAFRELDGTIAGSNLEEQVKMMTSMPDEMRRMLEPAQVATLANIEQQQALLDQNRDSIQEIVDLGDNATNSQKDTLTVLRAQREQLESQMSTLAQGGEAIRESLRNTEATLKAAQSQTRAYDSQLKLVNAISSANSDIYSKSVAGERARIQRHNEALRLQQAQLNVQINLQEVYIQQQEIAIQQLETKLDVLKATRDIGIEEANNARRQAQTNKSETRLAAERASVSQEAINSIDAVITRLTASNELSTKTVTLGSLTFATDEAREAAQAYATAAQQYARANQIAITAIDLTDRRAAIRELRENISALRTQVDALDQQTIGSAEEAVLIRRVAQELANETAIRENEITNITAENANLQLKINDTLSTRQNILKTNLSTLLVTAAGERRAMAQEAGHNIAMLRLERDRIKARAERMPAGPELTAANEAIANLNTQIDQETTLNRLRQERHGLTIQQQILDQIVDNGIEGAISKYQESLELRRRELDLVTQLAEKQTEIAQNQSRIAIARTGATVDENTSRAMEWETAERAYQLARAQSTFRLAAIEAEYDLLEYKREADVQTLRTQAYLVQSFNRIFNRGQNDPVLDNLLNNINAAANNLERVSTDSARELARQAAQADLTLARQRAELARATYEGSRNPAGAAAQAGANWVAEQQATLRARRAAFQDLNSPSNLRDTTNRTTEAMREANQPMVDLLTSVKTELMTIRDAIIPVAQSIASTSTNLNASGISSSMSAEQMARQMYDYAKSTYGDLRVDEFGVNSGHGDNSLHYSNRAFDINAVSGEDAANPQALNRLNQVARDLSAKGMEVLWNGMIYQAGVAVARIPAGEDQHTDHLHAEVDSASYNRMKTLYSAIDTGASSGVSRASEEIVSPRIESTAIPPSPSTSTRTNTRIAFLDESEEQWNEYMRTVSASLQTELEALTKTLPIIEVKRDLFGELIDVLPGAMRIATAQMQEMASSLTEHLGQDFGPEGQVITALSNVMNYLTVQLPSAFETMGTSFEDWKDKQSEAVKQMDANVQQGIYQAERLSAAFNAAAAMIGTIASLLKSVSDAKIAGIDREIAAEQKRDGKSAASVAKMDALEQKKDAMARKSFNTQKKLMLAQAVMGTAAAVTSTLASMSAISLPPVPQIMAGIVGAMGLAQVAIISGMQYQSAYSPKSIETPSALSIGKRSDSVNLANGPNANAGGELAYIRGGAGTGSSASNFNAIGSAYGGPMQRGYGNRGFVVGEKGPEVITPETPINVTPANENTASNPVNATINIQAIDSQGVQDVLVAQKGNIIQMLRQAANASGQRFLEDVNVNVYTRPSVGKLL